MLSNSMMKNFSENIKVKLEELNSRITKAEAIERLLRETHSRMFAESRINTTPSSYKSEKK